MRTRAARLRAWLFPPRRRLDRLAAPRGQAAALLGVMFDLDTVALAVLDREGRILRASAGFRRLVADTGASLPASALALFAPAEREALGRDFAAALGGDLDAARRRATLLGPTPRRVEIGCAPLREADGTVSGLALSLFDLSSIHGLEEEVSHVRKLQAVGLLAGGIAHDFNNLLTAIGGAAEAAAEEAASGAAIVEIESAVARGAALVRQLLAFARQQTLQPEIVAVNDAVRSIAAMLMRLLGRNIVLTLELEEPGRHVRVDPSQLDQVLVNLAINARDAMPEGGRLTLASGHLTLLTQKTIGAETIPPGRYVTLTVADTGHGIAPEQLGRIFEPFFTTKRDAGGSGLGLATVHGIVRQSGGFLIVESAPGAGTRVHIHFPRVAAPLVVAPKAVAPEAVIPEAVIPEAPPVMAAPGREEDAATVLLVEDEAPVRRLAERALRRRGFAVRAADSAEAALALLEDGTRPDLVVSDVMMPGMDGPALLATLRRRWPDLPAILVSGYAAQGARRALAEEEAIFLAKPYTLAALAEAVTQSLKRRATA